MELTLTTPFTAENSGTIKEVRAIMRTQTADTALCVLVTGQPEILSDKTMIGRWKTGSKVTVNQVTSVSIQEGDLIEAISVGREDPEITTVVRSPNGISPKWKVWRFQFDAPKWFGVGASVLIMALAAPENTIATTISSWDKTTGKFEIAECTLPTKWDYTSWSVSLASPTLATIETCEVVVEYPDPVVESELEPEPTPEPDEPASPSPKRRRIMM